MILKKALMTGAMVTLVAAMTVSGFTASAHHGSRHSSRARTTTVCSYCDGTGTDCGYCDGSGYCATYTSRGHHGGCH